jgi:hypothetical protein
LVADLEEETAMIWTGEKLEVEISPAAITTGKFEHDAFRKVYAIRETAGGIDVLVEDLDGRLVWLNKSNYRVRGTTVAPELIVG